MNKLKWKTAEIVEKEERVSSEAVLSLIEWGVSDSCFICWYSFLYYHTTGSKDLQENQTVLEYEVDELKKKLKVEIKVQQSPTVTGDHIYN